MAREIVVSFDGSESRFGIQRLDREKLYGRKRRIVVDQNDEECSTALLTRDGTALIPSGGTASLYTTDRFSVVDRRDLIAVDDDGNPLEKLPSTLGEPQAVQGPVPPQRLLDHIVGAVYLLDPLELDDTLKERLEAGDIYEIPFNYMPGFDQSSAFLLHTPEGFFALVGDPTGFEYVYPEEQVVEEEEEDDPFADDFDFSMM